MNLRKKLTVASILMILMPIVVSVLLCIIVVFSKGSSTLNRLKSLYAKDNGILNVQAILYNYKDQILSYEPLDSEDVYNGNGTENQEELDDDTDNEDDWYGGDDADDEDSLYGDDDTDDEDELNDDDDLDDDDDDLDDLEEEQEEKEEEAEEMREIREARQRKTFSGLIGELTNLEYYYEITCQGKTEMTNLPEDSREQIAEIAGQEYEKVSNFAVSDKESSAVKRTYSEDEKVMTVLAFCDHAVEADHQMSQAIRDILSIAGIFSAVLLISIVFSIFILTKWLAGGMKNSLDQLSEGVKQVQEGNLSYRIHSKRKDELGKACEEFNEMTEYLEHSVEEREFYEEARKQMIAGISHDLRTPLTSIKAYVEGLRDGIANTEEKKQRYYAALMTRTGDLEALIDNLSLFSRFDRGEYHYVMEKIELGSFIEDFLRNNEIEFQKNGLYVQKTAWPREPLLIEGDKKQLKRVLGNLIDNTIKYRDKEETGLSVGLWKYKDKIWLEIMDDGPGVPEEERNRIFDTFYRGDKARQNPGNGSGLGLAIVREILKGHGAKIRAEEGDGGRGLKLIIEFPQGKYKEESREGDE